MLPRQFIPKLVDSELLHYLGELVHEAKLLAGDPAKANAMTENAERQVIVKAEIAQRGLFG